MTPAQRAQARWQRRRAVAVATFLAMLLAVPSTILAAIIFASIS